MTNQWVTPTSQMCFFWTYIKKKFFESDINIKKLEDAIQNRMYLGFLFFLENPWTWPQACGPLKEIAG